MKPSWDLAMMETRHISQRLMKQRAKDIGQIARTRRKPFQGKLACMVKKQYVSKGLLLDPFKFGIGNDNSGDHYRYNAHGVPGKYFASFGQNGLPGNVIAESGHYKNRHNGVLPSSQDYWAVNVVIPPTDIVVVVQPSEYLIQEVVDPFDDTLLQEWDLLTKEERKLWTEAYGEIFKSAPQNEKDLHISQEMADLLTRGQTLTTKSLLSSNGYMMSQVIGSAILLEDIGVQVPSARAHTVPQQAFLTGSSNVILPLDGSYDTGCIPVGAYEVSYDLAPAKPRVKWVTVEELMDRLPKEELN